MLEQAAKRRQQRATIIDVARKAGVSFKTVSRVLNGEDNVRKETRKVVLDAAKSLNYSINMAARSLRTGGPQIIALLIQNPSRSYIESAYLGAMQRCYKTGAHLIMEECSAGLEPVAKMIADTSPMGIIVTPPLSDDKELIALIEESDIPYVLIAPEDPKATRASINMNNQAAARDMTRHLIALGHKRIGFIKGHSEHSVTDTRYQGYRQAMEEEGLPIEDELVEQGSFDWASGLECAERLLDLPNRPSAVFASNDDMAAAVIAAAYRRNIHVPDDLSVAGFDNTQVAAVISPQLTTVNQPIADIAAAAVGLFVEHNYRGKERLDPIFLDYEIVERESASAV